MKVFLDIPVELKEADLISRLKVACGPEKPDAWRPLITRALRLIRPRAIIKPVRPALKGSGVVELDGVVLSSPLLARCLVGVSKVFPYVLTIGPDLENAASSDGDLLNQYYLETFANLAIGSAEDWLRNHLEAAFQLGHLAGLSPGSLPDWPLTEQALLFSIFRGREKAIGVRLTDSCLMIPRKSISGIMFPSTDRFVACRLCAHENCQGRKAPFSPNP